MISRFFVNAPKVSEFKLMAWVDTAAPGARLVYHDGFLAVDTTSSVSTLRKPALEDLRATANAAFRLCELGRIHLVQERLGPDRFAYVAIVRPHNCAVLSAAVKQLAAAA